MNLDEGEVGIVLALGEPHLPLRLPHLLDLVAILDELGATGDRQVLGLALEGDVDVGVAQHLVDLRAGDAGGEVEIAVVLVPGDAHRPRPQLPFGGASDEHGVVEVLDEIVEAPVLGILRVIGLLLFFVLIVFLLDGHGLSSRVDV